MDEQGTRNRSLELITQTACIAGLFIVGIGLFEVRFLFPIIGWISAGVVVVALCCAIALILEFTARRLFRSTMHDIGQFGTIERGFLKSRNHAPLLPGSVSVKELKKPEIVVPTVAELLKAGDLGTSDLLLGYVVSTGKALLGSWGDINTFCIAGRSRSGKTITLFFIILQAVLNGAVVWVADPHGAGRKQSALKALLSPLSQWIRFACKDDEIENMANEYIDIMTARIEGRMNDFRPFLFCCDEFNGIAQEKPILYELVNRAAREWAGVYGYAVIAGHEWAAVGKGAAALATLRRNLHAKFVHKLDEGYAKFLLNSKKWARDATKMRTGNALLQDVEGDIVEIRIPFGTREDAQTVATMLAFNLETGDTLLELSEGQDEPKEEISISDFTDFTRETEVLQLKPVPETKRLDYQGRKELIQQLRSGNALQSEILQRVYQVKPGASSAYKEALTEYKRILEELKMAVNHLTEQ